MFIILIIREIWKDIEDYEGWYQVSNIGRVRSVTRTITYSNGGVRICEGRILKLNYKKKTGYYNVELNKNGKAKTFRVNRLVAKAFVDNPDPNNYDIVNHLDGVKTNNIYTNLEWTDQSGNQQHAVDNGLQKYEGKLLESIINNCKQANKRKSKKVAKVDPISGQVLKEYESLSDAEKDSKIHHNSISKCCRGIYNLAGGYKWKFIK